MRIVLLGPPGAGKGTQAKKLAAKLGLSHISTGDLLRQNVARQSDLGKEAKDYMNKGLLVPDALVTRMLTERFGEPDVKKGFILDGYPRNIKQAVTLDEVLKGMSMPIDLVFDLACSEEVIIQRLSGRLVCRKCGANFHRTNMPPAKEGICDNCGGELYQRADDNVETIKKRILVYKDEVSALIEYYQKNKLLKRVNSDGAADEVLEEMVRLVSNGENDPLKI